MIYTENYATIHNLLKEPFAQIHYEPANRILYCEWTGYLKLDETRESCQMIIDFVKEHQLKRQLSVHSRLKILSMPLQDYLINDFFPQLEQNGLRKTAVILSDDVFAQVTAENVGLRAGSSRHQIKSFTAMEEARGWLTRE